MVYLLASKYGIVVLENYLTDTTNSNVTQEFGFIEVMGRKTLVLRDQDFEEVRADMLCRISQSYDSSTYRRLEETISRRIHDWMPGKGERLI